MGAKRSGYFGKVHTLRRTAGLWLVVVEKVEEYRGRCDDLFADLMECQEQLRVERSRNGAVEMESKRLRTGREWSGEELLLRVDCQHVGEWWRCDGQNLIREQQRVISHLERAMMMKDHCTLPECNETTFSAMNDFYRRLRALEV